jgi:hypothetical protein
LFKTDYVVLGQIVDALKLHFYHGEATTAKALIDYLRKISALGDLKDEAYSIKNANNEMRFVNHTLGGDKFRVMATTVKGFSVTLENQDVSISFKSVSQKTEKDYPEKYDFNTIVESKKQPVIRVEFRASFLARVGHKNAIDYVLRLIRREFIQSYQIKVSEIHLATDIQGYNFHELDRQRFRTRKKTSTGHDQERDSQGFYYFGKKFTGFSFGSGSDMMRVYNKTVEITQNPDKAFIKMFVWEQNPNYNPDREVWRIEAQYRREKLKTMYDDENGLLDGFENVLKAIPSLWKRALESFTLIDLPEQKAIDHFMGFERHPLGHKIPLETNTVSMRIKRASVHPLWEQISSWNFSIGSKIKILTAPVTGAFQWVSNSIKSLLSTLLKYSGDLSPKILEDAFLRAQEETMIDKGLSLVDNAVNNTLDYLGACVKYVDQTGENHHIERDLYSTLKINLPMYVREITNNLWDVYGTNDDYSFSRARILNKSLARLAI